MFGFITQVAAAVTLFAFGNILLGSCALAGAGVWLMTTSVGDDDE